MKRIYIFLSYGHDKYANRTQTLYEQLQKNDGDFVIWWDNKLEVSEDWIVEIEKNLNNLIINKSDSSFIYVITPYSANVKRDNFCIKEIVKVLGNNVRVIPVKLAEAPLPLLLGNIQWIDFTDIDDNQGNAEFINRITKLCEIIRDKKEPSNDGKQAMLMSKLEPCSFTLELKKHLENYEPRQWLLQTVKDWIEGDGKRILLLTGGPGTGKTAFSIWMSYSELSQYVCAWHLCQYSNRKGTCDLRSAVKSMAYLLSTRIPAYYRNMDIAKVDRILKKAESDPEILFKELILIPLSIIGDPGHTVVILIDALDEATENNMNGLAEIIHEYVYQLPQWLKIIITTRDVSSVMTFLRDCSYVINLDDSLFVTNSRDDVNRYVNTMLRNRPQYIQKVVTESGNNFLYAQLLCNTIQQNPDYKLDELPLDINAYYNKYLRRYFPKFTNAKSEFDTHAYPLLLLILTSYEPIQKKMLYERLHQIADWCVNPRVLDSLIQNFGPLLKEVDGFIFPFHKSLYDWFLDKEKNWEYSIDKKYCLEAMINWGLDVIHDSSSQNQMTKYFYLYLPLYMVKAESPLFESYCLDMSFLKKRRNIIGVSQLSDAMTDELALCKPEVKQRLLNNEQFVTELADIYYCALKYKTAESFFRKAIELRKASNMQGQEQDIQIAELYVKLAKVYYKVTRYFEAETLYIQALDTYKKYDTKVVETIDADIARTCIELGDLYYMINRHEDAHKLFVDAYHKYTELFNSGKNYYKSALAEACNKIVYLNVAVYSHCKDESYYVEAMKIKQLLTQQDPVAYFIFLERIINKLGQYWKEKGNINYGNSFLQEAERIASVIQNKQYADNKEEYRALNYDFYDQPINKPFIEQVLQESLLLYKELTNENPEAYETSLAKTYNVAGMFYTQIGEELKAEMNYKQAIDIGERLVNREKATKPNLAACYSSLSQHYAAFSQYEKAEKYALQAIDIYTSVSKESGAFDTNLARNFFTFANLCVKAGKYKEAEENYMRSILLYIKLYEKSSRAYVDRIINTVNNVVTLLDPIESTQWMEEFVDENKVADWLSKEI